MQRVAEIQQLFAFDRWANARMVDAAAQLTPEQYTRDLRSSYPSLRDTLVHIQSSEWVWLSRWQGASPRAFPEHLRTESVDELRRHWVDIEEGQRAFLSELTDEKLDAVLSYTMLSGDNVSSPMGQMLRHVINHSTYHRGQATTMLRQLGAVPPNTDLISFYRLQS